MSQDKAIQAEQLPLKALTLGDNSTTAEIHAWIRAWHSSHLVTLPSGAGENLNQIFWDGQYIFGNYTLHKDLKADLYRWGFDEGRARAVLHDLYRAKPKPVPTAFEIEKEKRQQQELLQGQLESQAWHLKLQQEEKQRNRIKFVINFVLAVLWILLILYGTWKWSKLTARRLADSSGSPL